MSDNRDLCLNKLFSTINGEEPEELEEEISQEPVSSSTQAGKKIKNPDSAELRIKALSKIVKFANKKPNKVNKLTPEIIKRKTKLDFIEFLKDFYSPSFDLQKL